MTKNSQKHVALHLGRTALLGWCHAFPARERTATLRRRAALILFGRLSVIASVTQPASSSTQLSSGSPQNAKSQRATILHLLREVRGRWLPSPEIAACAQQYNARLLELRRLSFCIENRTETDPDTGVRRSWFRLVSSSSSKLPQTKPRLPTGSNQARLADLPLFDSAVRR